MADTIIGGSAKAHCQDCGQQGTRGSHCGPLVPSGSGWVDLCAGCFSDRSKDYDAGIPPKAIGWKKEGSVWARGLADCQQDRCENVPFASIGGLPRRDDPECPKYIKPEEWAEYRAGYEWCARAMFGADWRTCTFSWQPALEIP